MFLKHPKQEGKGIIYITDNAADRYMENGWEIVDKKEYEKWAGRS